MLWFFFFYSAHGCIHTFYRYHLQTEHYSHKDISYNSNVFLNHTWWSAQRRALCTKISEVNVSALIYRLFHEVFSSFVETNIKISYYKSSSVCLFVCLSVCLFVPYLLRGPLTDLRQTWWVYVGGPRNCP